MYHKKKGGPLIGNDKQIKEIGTQKKNSSFEDESHVFEREDKELSVTEQLEYFADIVIDLYFELENKDDNSEV